jgi:hypothetical protein
VDALRTHWASWGFTSEAIDLVLSSFTVSTLASYDSHWRHWTRWTAKQRPPVPQTNPSPQDIANFSAELLRAPGGTKRATVAAVKTTLSLLTNREAVEKALQTGMRKLRPDKVKYDSFFSLDGLWAQMEKIPWSDLTLASKRQRLMVALSIDTLARSMDLVHLYAECVMITAQPITGAQGMFVSYAVPKHGGLFTPRLWVQRYDRDRELCSVWMMQRWLEDTAHLRWGSIQMEENGRERAYTPVFCNLQQKRVGHALSRESAANIKKSFLASAGVDTSRYTGHSIRGAAVTAAILAGDGSDAWKENLRALGRWKGLACMMRHYCVPVGVLPPKSLDGSYPTAVSEAVRRRFE